MKAFILLFFSLHLTLLGPLPIRAAELTPECLKRGRDQYLNVGTWNLQDFPKQGQATLKAAAETLALLNWDVIAVQEMSSIDSLLELRNSLNEVFGAEVYAAYSTTNSFFPLGIIFNQEKLDLVQPAQDLYTDDRHAFPRPALYLKLQIKESLKEFGVINIHLKCCRGAENTARRARAVELLDQFAQSAGHDMIILGDFNHDIIPARLDSPYRPFLDNDFYQIADLNIATGDSLNWSFPRGPFHLDHIILSGEFARQKVSVATHPIDRCRHDYFDILSDHRPVSVELDP